MLGLIEYLFIVEYRRSDKGKERFNALGDFLPVDVDDDIKDEFDNDEMKLSITQSR